jgi:hypothetical protein
MSTKSRHTAFLVRWQEEGEGTRWRSTVENAYTGQKLHFSDKSELLRFLWQSLYQKGALDLPGEDDRRRV